MAVSFSPNTVKGDSWSSYQDGTINWNYPVLDVTSVTFDPSAKTLTVTYNFYLKTTHSERKGYYIARAQAWVNGTSVGNYQNGTWYDTDWNYDSSDNTKYTLLSGKTATITWNGSATQSFEIKVRALFDWGYNDDRWSSSSMCSDGSATVSVTGLIDNPTVDGTVTSGAVGAGSYSYTVTKQGTGTISGQTWTFKNSSGTTLATKTDASGTATGLGSNQNISWTLNVTASDGGSASDSGTFYTRHNAPSIGTVSVNVGTRSGSTYGGTISYPVTYDGASYSSHSFQYGTSSSSLTSNATSTGTGTSASWSISGLAPNTTYYYKITETDNGAAATTSATKTGQFKTTALKPTINAPTFVSNTTGQIVVSFSATGDTNAPVTGYQVYYKKTDASSYSTSGSLSASTTQYTITGLTADTNYNIYVAATNAIGTTNSAGSIYSTRLNTPSLTLSAPTLAEDTVNDSKFTATLKPVASVSPSRTLTYKYSCSLSGVSDVTTTSATHTFSNLPEETSMTFTVTVTADATGNNASDTTATKSVSATTDSAQAKVRMKVNGAWVQGKLFIKKNGAWVKAKKVYIKKSGAWVQGKNQ